jgi:methane monooxygenase PmoA-like
MTGVEVSHLLDRSITASADDVDLFTYVYRPDAPQLESPKPYVHPIRTRSGQIVSLFRPHDHVWHKGISWALPHVGEENFWGGPTYRRNQFYVQLANDGAQNHRGFTQLDHTDDLVSIGHELDWVTERGELLFTESRHLHATLLGEAAWALIFETRMTNVSGAVVDIGSPTTKGRDNAGYGGLFWRGPRSFTGGRLVGPGGSGGDELRGQRSGWMAFVGKHDNSDATSTVLMVDDVANPNHPPQWFARSGEFACLNPAPFFSEELSVADGETITFRIGVAIADGDWSDTAAVLADETRSIMTSTDSRRAKAAA